MKFTLNNVNLGLFFLQKRVKKYKLKDTNFNLQIQNYYNISKYNARERYNQQMNIYQERDS